MRQALFVPLLVLFSLSVANAEPTLKGTPPELSRYLSTLPNIVQIVGDADLDVQAKKGIASIKITTEDELLKTSLVKNQRIKNEIISALVKQGIDQERIIGTKFSSTPEYGFWSKKTKGYKVENILKITVNSEREFQTVAGIIDKYEEVTYHGIELKYEDKEKFKYELINMALNNADNKKKIYEKELNLKLVPKGFQEDMKFGADTQLIYQGGREKKAVSGSYGFSESDIGTSIRTSFGQSKYYIRIVVEYYVNKR